jgi:5'-methylthioadenosine phosphorylase
VTVTEILSNLTRNAEHGQEAIRRTVRDLPTARSCKCGQALKHAIITDPSAIPIAARKRLAVIVGKYLPGKAN